MSTADGIVHVQRGPQGSRFRVIGRATMRQSPALLRGAEQCLNEGSAVQVDLSQCSYADSTFLGTLLALKRMADGKGGGRFALVAPSAQCSAVLKQMGLDRAIPVIAGDGGEAQGEWVELGEDDAPKERTSAVQETVVRAHQELADWPSPGTQQFKAIAAKLTQAWEAHKSGDRASE